MLEWSGAWGRYPAAAALFAFVAELAHPQPGYPRTLAIAIALYSYWALAGMAVPGRDAWTPARGGVCRRVRAARANGALRRAERLGGRPLAVRGLAGDDRVRGHARVRRRPPGGRRLDGFNRTSTWLDLLTDLRRELASSSQRVVDLATTFLNVGGLTLLILLILAAYLTAVAAAQAIGRVDRSLARLRAAPRPDRRGVPRGALLHALHPGGCSSSSRSSPTPSGAGGTSSGRPTTHRISRRSRPRPCGTCRSLRSWSGTSSVSRSHDRAVVVFEGAAPHARGAASDARPDGAVYARRDVAADAWLVAHGGLAGAIVEASLALALVGVLVARAAPRAASRSRRPTRQPRRRGAAGVGTTNPA